MSVELHVCDEENPMQNVFMQLYLIREHSNLMWA